MKSVTRRSRCAAIRAKCADCIYDESAPGTELQQITLCRALDCPLWPLRPVTRSPIPKTVLEAYRVGPDDPVWKSISVPVKAEKSCPERTNVGKRGPGASVEAL